MEASFCLMDEPPSFSHATGSAGIPTCLRARAAERSPREVTMNAPDVAQLSSTATATLGLAHPPRRAVPRADLDVSGRAGDRAHHANGSGVRPRSFSQALSPASTSHKETVAPKSKGTLRDALDSTSVRGVCACCWDENAAGETRGGPRVARRTAQQSLRFPLAAIAGLLRPGVLVHMHGDR
jgi:hypothetical protein